MRTGNAAVSLLACVFTACSTGDNSATTVDNSSAVAVDEVRARLDGYVMDARAGNVAALSAYWTDDAVIMGHEEQVTAAEQHRVAAELLGANNVTTFETDVRERVAHDGGTVVYEFGSYNFVLTPKDGKSAPVTVKRNFAARWVKSADGTWQMHRFISTLPPADSVPVEVAAPAVAAVAGAALDAAAVSAQINQATNEFTAKINASDAAGALVFLADDVQLYEPDVQIMSKAGFGQMLDFVFAGNTVNMAITSDLVFSHDGGAMVYQFAHFDETFATKDGKAPAVFLRNNLLARWKRAADGRYVMDRIIVSRMPGSN